MNELPPLPDELSCDPRIKGDMVAAIRAYARAAIASRDEEIERLRAKVEVAEAAAKAAVSKAEWQAVTNSELNALTDENARLRGLLVKARAEVEFWTPDESNASSGEMRFLNLWFDLRDRIDAALPLTAEHAQRIGRLVVGVEVDLDKPLGDE